jgi:hypothetical protein
VSYKQENGGERERERDKRKKEERNKVLNAITITLVSSVDQIYAQGVRENERRKERGGGGARADKKK